MDTGILLGISGIVVTILFGIVGPLFIPNRLSQRQKATGAHSTAMQSGRDTIVIHGSATFHGKTSDAHSSELPIAVIVAILLDVVSGYYIWEKSYPLELQNTIVLELAVLAILLLLVIVPILLVRLLFIKPLLR